MLSVRRATTHIAAATIESDRNGLFEFLVDPRNTDRWLDGVRYISHRPPGPIALNSDVISSLPTGLGRLHARFRFTRLQYPSSFVIEGSAIGIQYTSTMDLAEGSNASQTNLTWTVSLSIPRSLKIGFDMAKGAINTKLSKQLQNLSNELAI